MHIGDGTSESFARKDDLLRRFLDYAAANADALIIAGDGFDLAQAWSVERIVRGHRALIDDLAAVARTMPVYSIEGNHGPAEKALGEIIPFHYAEAFMLGDHVRVEHGNAFDARNQSDDEWAFWGCVIHAALERVIGSPVRTPMRKHYCWSTRLGHWLFFRYGQYISLKGRAYEVLSRPEVARDCAAFLDYWGACEWGDPNGMIPRVEAYLSTSPVGTLVCGHSHQPGVVELPGGKYVNSGSWTFDDSTYVAYRDGEVEVRSWPDHRRITDEEYRGALGPHRGKSFFDWWQKFYRGWFRYDVDAMHRAAAGDPLGE
jgi:UDP-2,3-diacylglucosamine pyrophosphatase LpxH